MTNSKHKLGNKCVYCGCKEKLYLNIDHIIPKCRGGKDTEENTQTTCIMCNNFKNGFSEAKFLKMMKHLRGLRAEGVVSINMSHKIVFAHQ